MTVSRITLAERDTFGRPHPRPSCGSPSLSSWPAAWCGVLLLPVLFLVLAGCQTHEAPTSSAEGANQSEEASNAAEAAVATEEANQKAREAGAKDEFWEVFYIEGAKVGHGHTARETVQENGQSLIRTTSESELTMNRFGQTITQELHLQSVETPDGRLVRCSSKTSQGPVTMETTGTVEDDQLHLKTTTLGKTQSAATAWDPSWGSYFADQQSLREQPMQEGEERTLHALIPLFNQPGKIEMEAVGTESVELPSGEKELLRIETKTQLGQTAIDSVLWTDDRGRPLKSSTFFSGVNQVSYRTSREVATGEAGSEQFDLGQNSIVKIDRELNDPHRTERVVYRARLSQGDPVQLFADSGGQSVERIDDQTARISVRALQLDQPAGQSEKAPSEADRGPNNLIQSDDAQIQKLAGEVAPDEQDPWRLACALESYVREAVRTKDFTQAMASAADVARSREGDCTEHAVLLAALCRARGIPARVAIGLVYYPQAAGFAYHMWNEAWIEDRWMPLDGTLGNGGIGAAHLKVTDSNLEGVTPLNALLPVLEVLGRLELEILDVE